MPGSGTGGQTLGYFLTSTCFPIPPWPPERGPCSPRCLATRATVVSIKARKIELALVNPGSDDLGRTRCTPSREIVRFATDQRTTKAPSIPRRISPPTPKPSSRPICPPGQPASPLARETNGMEHSHLRSQTRHLKRYLCSECGTSPEPDLKVDAA